ncbi:hypothetical protein ABIB40_002982 [Pedobacter sp. UYP30]|uniref:hypothetical protein n=1 Tax=Pedobacter sp. UYP30 TaxID=1756400 RepID=UPI003395F81D
MKIKKYYLIAGLIILLISALVIFPIESAKTDFIMGLGYTYLTAIIGVLVTMYGLMGNKFFKGLLFVFCSAIFSFFICIFFFVVIAPDVNFFSTIIATWIAIPIGILAAVIFLFVNYRFIADENKYKLFFKRLICYLLILAVLGVLFFKGSDWISSVSEFIKGKTLPIP